MINASEILNSCKFIALVVCDRETIIHHIPTKRVILTAMERAKAGMIEREGDDWIKIRVNGFDLYKIDTELARTHADEEDELDNILRTMRIVKDLGWYAKSLAIKNAKCVNTPHTTRKDLEKLTVKRMDKQIRGYYGI